jgi:hypothetical protein
VRETSLGSFGENTQGKGRLKHEVSFSTDDDAKNLTLADFDIKQSKAASNLALFEAELNNFSQNNYSLQTELEESTNRLSARDVELQSHALTSVESGEKLSTLLSSKYQELEIDYSSWQHKSNPCETEV